MSEMYTMKSVRKFDGTNFQVWKFHITNVFVSVNLKGLVYGTEKRLTVTESDLHKAWDKKNGQAMAILSDAMTDDQLELLLTYTTAAEMFTQIRTTHEERSECNKALLLQKFNQCK